MSLSPLSRRRTLHLLGAGALAGAAWPARLALAAAPTRPDPEGARLVVLMLRGALDGLAAVPAPGDPAFAALRPAAEGDAPALALDGVHALHPALVNLHRWYAEGQLLVLHAVGQVAYRERSHFDAQQLLESGGERPFALPTGWLGRALQLRGAGGVALTSAMPLALRGAEAASTWTPTRAAMPSGHEDLLARVAELYRDDPALHQAFAQATGAPAMGMVAAGAEGAFTGLARQAGQFLAAPDGPRVAWLESGGWDTHAQQAPRLARLLAGLDHGLQALREGLAASWKHSSVLVLTEFGRSALPNGTGGTDHGTGGIALLAGGAVAGGRVLADWPGLGRADLFDGRDLRPTRDLRAVLAPVLQRQFGLDAARIRSVVLPGVGAWRDDFFRS